MKSFFEKILTVIFPDTCVGCSRSGALLCERCLDSLPPSPSPEHSFITSVYAYRDERVRALVRMLKYKNTRHAAVLFAPAMARALTEIIGEEQMMLGKGDVYLVPIPLSKARRKTRGYNQAELLAESMLDYLDMVNIKIDTGLLKKIRDTRQQADTKDRTERLRNLEDCFFAEPARKHTTIILLDDVTTTGATLLAAQKALRAAGHRKIYALTAAH